MELKHVLHPLPVTFGSLLIVPYGIETDIGSHLRSAITLLIVPYGIETGHFSDF